MKKSLLFSKKEQLLLKKGYCVIGVDEVGRGSLAGPVVASAVAFLSVVYKSKRANSSKRIRIDDSKKLTIKQRNASFQWIKKNCFSFSTQEISVSQINKMGIASAALKAMRKAVQKVVDRVAPKSKPYILTDYYHISYLRGINGKQEAIIRGDQKHFAIASASIIAKVHRDKLMKKLAKRFNNYWWHLNVGYGTKKHICALKKYGPTNLHRKNFIRKIL